MGRDKALLPVAGRPMALIATDALLAAGAVEVFCVGGDAAALFALGLDVRQDDHPGEGPLTGLLTARRQASEEVVVVMPCDVPGAAPAAVTAVLAALVDAPGVDAAVPVAGGRRQFLQGAYRRTALLHWEPAFASGERSVHRASRDLTVVDVTGLDPRWLYDADRPEDLPRDAG